MIAGDVQDTTEHVDDVHDTTEQLTEFDWLEGATEHLCPCCSELQCLFREHAQHSSYQARRTQEVQGSPFLHLSKDYEV